MTEFLCSYPCGRAGFQKLLTTSRDFQCALLTLANALGMSDTAHYGPDKFPCWRVWQPSICMPAIWCTRTGTWRADGFKLWIALSLVLTAIVASTPYSTLIVDSNPYQAYIALCIAFDKRVCLLSLIVPIELKARPVASLLCDLSALRQHSCRVSHPSSVKPASVCAHVCYARCNTATLLACRSRLPLQIACCASLGHGSAAASALASCRRPSPPIPTVRRAATAWPWQLLPAAVDPRSGASQRCNPSVVVSEDDPCLLNRRVIWSASQAVQYPNEFTIQHLTKNYRMCCAALMAIIASGTFLGGTLGPTPHKIAVVMTVTVFHSVILCQYVGCTPRGCQVGLNTFAVHIQVSVRPGCQDHESAGVSTTRTRVRRRELRPP